MIQFFSSQHLITFFFCFTMDVYMSLFCSVISCEAEYIVYVVLIVFFKFKLTVLKSLDTNSSVW